MNIKPSLSHVTAYPVSGCSRRGKIRLDMNENLFNCSSRVLQALRRIRPDDVSVYPEYMPLCRAIAGSHGLKPENVCLTDGADEGIRALMEAFIETNDDVIIPRPSFSIFKLAAQLQRARIKEIPYRKDFSYPATEVIAAITPQTRLVVAVSPNNPTGTTLDAGDLKSILAKVKGGLVALDHTYCLFTKTDFSSLVSCHPNLLVIHSFSKIHGLAGLRIGYILADARTVANMKRVLPPFSVNSLALIAASVALADREHISKTKEKTLREKSYICRSMQRMRIRTHPGEANFILAHFGKAGRKLVDGLAKEGILVKRFPDEPLLSGWVRITAGRRPQNQRLLNTLERLLSDLIPTGGVL